MLFNSLHFLLFFPVFCFLYFSVPKQHQWKILVAGGYYFYGNFSPFFAIILFVITCNDFLAGIMMDKASTQQQKKKWLFLSMVGNLGIFWRFLIFLGLCRSQCLMTGLYLLVFHFLLFNL